LSSRGFSRAYEPSWTFALAVLSFVVSTPPHIQTFLLVSVVVGCCVGFIAGFFALRARVLRRVVLSSRPWRSPQA
jgi:hypothetical protein